MPRVHHVRRARKKNPVAEIGESYYWWKFRYGDKRYSKEPPRRSQLTQSSFLSTLWDLEDNLPDEITEAEAEDLLATLEELSEECQSSLDNMPDQLQEASILSERIDGIDGWLGEIWNIDWSGVTPAEAAEIIKDANPGLS
jgi:hypothetical protein